MFDVPLQSGADLFYWIVAILVAFVAALSFIDFSSSQGPTDPHHSPGDEAYWESRKHAEDVHREFPIEQTRASKDPVREDSVKEDSVK